MTLQEIRALKFNAAALHCPAQAVDGCRIPTLEEVLTTLRDETTMHVTIELKVANVELPALQIVTQTRMLSRVNMSSFVHERVIKVKQAEPRISIALLFNPNSSPTPPDFTTLCIAAAATQAHMRYDMITPQLVSQAHASGIRVMVWFRSVEAMIAAGLEHEERLFPALVAMGVDVICTNSPEKLAALLRA